MPKGIYTVPAVTNEVVRSYAPNSTDRKELQAALSELRSKEVDLPMYVGSKEIRTGNKVRMAPPHDHQHTLGHFHRGDSEHVQQAIDAALEAKEAWASCSWKNN